ncbi:unnamed protein product [Larinioides sclopetarius]|uniref:Uncharacterized protein n=1 Tax=Larinioides sclopetarius TaxID=280406 RepID=A0AAV1ZX11_9ARAC
MDSSFGMDSPAQTSNLPDLREMFKNIDLNSWCRDWCDDELSLGNKRDPNQIQHFSLFKAFALPSSKINDMFLANDIINFARFQRGLQPKRIGIHKFASRKQEFHEDLLYVMKFLSRRNEKKFKLECADLNIENLNYDFAYKRSQANIQNFFKDIKDIADINFHSKAMCLMEFMSTEAHWSIIYEENGVIDGSELIAFFICQALDFCKKMFYSLKN